jgi:GTPase SAR1 family protein
MWNASDAINKRLRELEQHLQTENPILVSVVKSFRKLDKVGYAMGLVDRNDSYANQISWWPLITVLGTFSSGKSTFINHYLGYPLQDTGNQAVDDKFTVICFSPDAQSQTLPGIALDADPRFPFYQISSELDKVAPGEGGRIDTYLQLKTCNTAAVKGRILIDSPGFDADAQRQSILRSTDHIIDLSDLVLVFFDARHPEPGAMRETLQHLVSQTIHRADATKFLYILNQIDTAAREDNPEDVIASWQRALAQEGLTAGKFYSIYNQNAAVPIEDEEKRKRYESKRDHDLGLIHSRMENVTMERSYRIISLLEKNARDIEQFAVPKLREMLGQWRRKVLWLDLFSYSFILIVLIAISVAAGYWQGWKLSPELLKGGISPWLGVTLLVITGIALTYVHFMARKLAGNRVLKWVKRQTWTQQVKDMMISAFDKNTRPWRSIFSTEPTGWNSRNQGRLHDVLSESNEFIQTLNNRYTNPSGMESRRKKE